MARIKIPNWYNYGNNYGRSNSTNYARPRMSNPSGISEKRTSHPCRPWNPNRKGKWRRFHPRRKRENDWKWRNSRPTILNTTSCSTLTFTTRAPSSNRFRTARASSSKRQREAWSDSKMVSEKSLSSEQAVRNLSSGVCRGRGAGCWALATIFISQCCFFARGFVWNWNWSWG